jgi:glutamate synthase (NADH) large subunit (EC 1.4.1.14)
LVETNHSIHASTLKWLKLEIVSELPGTKKWLRKWIERHQDYTKSCRAASLLENWEKTLSQFVKVMPIEYRAVLGKNEK